MKKQLVLVIDFGGQYNQLIARRVREHNVYCEIVPYTYSTEKIKAKHPNAIIFTGGPNSVNDPGAPSVDKEVLELGVPVLGICYGHQLITKVLNGEVKSAEVREYGKTEVEFDKNCTIFNDVDNSVCWMSHTYQVSKLPEGFKVAAGTNECPIAAMANEEKKIYGVQFHPEVQHTVFGKQILSNFLFKVCKLKGDW